MLLVQEKLQEIGVTCDIATVISDFELNIIKSCDDMLEIDPEGCFFHFSKALKTKVDKHHFKTRYENDTIFQQFIKECGALAHLPLEDLEKGLEHIEEKYAFEDDKGKEFKDYFISYIRDYWINGCYPPQVWNCWSRTEDLTNNHQEGYNAKTNRVLRQIHPSPGILLCHVRAEIKLAEQLVSQARVGIEKPRGQPLYRKLAKRRLQMKKMYLEEKKKGNADIGSFLSNMGHNIMASLFCGKSNEVKKTLNPRASLIFDNGANHDVSTWVPDLELEESVLEQGENPYSQRKIGQTKRRQEEDERVVRIPWLGKKCPSCDHGFNRTSKLVQCHSCDSYTHKRTSCLSSGSENSIFHCKKCKTTTETIPPKKTHVGPLQCKFCTYLTSSKFNLDRHEARKHKDGDLPSDGVQTSENKTLESLLGDIGLDNLADKFTNEGIDLKLLLDLNSEDLRRMMQDLGVNWGDRYKIEKEVEQVKQNPIHIVENITLEETNAPIPVESMLRDDVTLEETAISEEPAENILQISDVIDTVNVAEDILQITDDIDAVEVQCILCAKAEKQENPQHKCRKCSKVVCSILCSIPDPESDNEMHRIHKHGDNRCLSEYSGQALMFVCPKCEEEFTCNAKLQLHITQKHGEFEVYLNTMSLASEGSLSDVYETCKQCGKLFENELDLANHIERVHEYGENFEIYPCEECGYRGTDITSIRKHIADSHEKSRNACDSLEELGIVALPVVAKRRKQNFRDLNIDDNGDIMLDDDEDDEDFESRDEILLAEEEDITFARSSKRNHHNSRKRKADTQVKEKKRQKVQTSTNTLQCSHCKLSFTRKDNLSRHIRNKH